MRVFRRGGEPRSAVEQPLGFADAESRTTFADVAGLDAIVDELRDLVDYLADPSRFERLGARPPTGVLLHGGPGCGKTLLGRALAGEVGVPFYYVSATSFVERFVGLGASRVRELFATAGADAPCIVFIDELDAAGRRRSDGDGDREFDHTLNQLLVELDGVLSVSGVVTIATTNRPGLLDPALIRPGRFDRRIEVPMPDSGGRLAVLTLYAASRPCAPEVDWTEVAAATEGRSPAELAGLVNEAALLAVRGRSDVVEWDHVKQALDRLDGLTRPLGPAELERVTVHEAGHALLDASRSSTDRRGVRSESELRAELAILFGGRAAERLLLGEASTLAEDDLAAARRLAELLSTLGDSAEVESLLRAAEHSAREILTQRQDDLVRLSEQLSAGLPVVRNNAGRRRCRSRTVE